MGVLRRSGLMSGAIWDHYMINLEKEVSLISKLTKLNGSY